MFYTLSVHYTPKSLEKLFFGKALKNPKEEYTLSPKIWFWASSTSSFPQKPSPRKPCVASLLPLPQPCGYVSLTCILPWMCRQTCPAPAEACLLAVNHSTLCPRPVTFQACKPDGPGPVICSIDQRQPPHSHIHAWSHLSLPWAGGFLIHKKL